MRSLIISSQRFRGIESRKRKLETPLGLHVIDPGGGLAPDVGDHMVDYTEKI